MASLFFTELLGAVFQLLIFSLIPFIWWLITARKKDSFFKWIGLKKIVHEKKVVNTLLITVLAVAVYILLTVFCIKSIFSNGLKQKNPNIIPIKEQYLILNLE